MNKLFESVNDLFESDTDLVNMDDSFEETLEEAISRAHEEELGAIGTYDTILSKIEEGTNEALVEMINEIKKDEEDHELLLKHFIETGEVWTDEDLKKDKESEDEDEESEDEDEDESSINEDYRDDVIRDLGIEPGSDEEAQVDEILNTVPTVYDVFTLSQVGFNEYKSDLYTTVEDEDQAYDIVAELGAQGINAFVESRDSNEDVIVPNNFLSGLYARDLNESTEGLSKEDKICRLEDKIKECKDRIEEINNTKSFDDGSYEAGLDLEDKAIERAWLERTISEYQKEIDELKGETITEGSKSDLYSIRGEIRDDETGRLMLHTRNKNTGLVGCANFFGNGDDKVIVYEGKGDGSDDKEMGFDEFLANYDYVLADEDEQPFAINEDESSGSTAILYQVSEGKTRDYGFESLEMLDKFGKELSLDNYTEVANIDYSKYTDATDTNAILEAIFREGNTNQDMRVEFPTMRSVSMSDIVLLNGRYYYCDDFGWTDVTDRLTSVNESEEVVEDDSSYTNKYRCVTAGYNTVETFDSKEDAIAFAKEDDRVYSIVSDLYQDGKLVSVGLNDIWSKYDEGLSEASSVDGLVTKFKELPYGDFKASNAIGILNDGTVFWADGENEVYSVPCSYAELKDAMYNKEQDDWMEFSQSFNRIEDPLATKILVAIGRNSEDVLDYQETFKDGLPF